jgi:pyroglutamyl-peptidase
MVTRSAPARISGNTGAQPVDEPVVPGGPGAYFSTLPIKTMLQAMQQADIKLAGGAIQ